MKKFLVLYLAPVAALRQMTERSATLTQEERDESMKPWEEWMTTNNNSLVDAGAPIGKTKRVDAAGISDTKNEVGGYSILQAESHEEAAKLVRANPHLEQMPGGWIEVMEIMPMPEK